MKSKPEEAYELLHELYQTETAVYMSTQRDETIRQLDFVDSDYKLVSPFARTISVDELDKRFDKLNLAHRQLETSFT
jgi:hypothetical protein